MIIFVFLGIIAAIFQLVTLREFTFSLAKNELSLVVAAGFWLIFCSLGSLAGIKRNLRSFYLPLLSSLFFSLLIWAIHRAKLLVGLSYYEAASLGFVLLSALLFIGPTSFLIGYSFCIFSQTYLKSHPYTNKTFANFFAYEAIGFFIGGLIFTFFLAGYSNPFIFAFGPILLALSLPSKKIEKIFSVLIITLLSFSFLISFKAILKKEFEGADILLNKGSPYGPIILTKKFGVDSLYVNGSLVSTSEDKTWNEEFIHLSLSASPDIKKVLFIGPYFGGQIQEMLKYNLTRLDCLDINPVLSSLSKARLPFKIREKVKFIVNDPRVYIRNTDQRYDCILMNSPAPSNLALNRYFSYEFWEMIKKRLSPGGIFSFYIPSKRDILSPQFVKFNSCLINTLDKVFKHRLLIPSDSMIIIASDTKAIDPEDLIKNFSKNKISTDFFTIYHLRDYLDAGHRSYIESMIDKKIEINSDFNPRGFLYYLLLEQAKFYPQLSIEAKKAKYFIIGFFIIIVLSAGFLSSLPKKLLFLLNASVVGFSSLGLTALVYVFFQLYSGALFWKIGILVGLFMAGLSLGTHLINLKADQIALDKRTLPYFYLAWALFLLSLFIGIRYLSSLFYSDFIFYIYSFLGGILTGGAYPIFTQRISQYKIDPQNVAPSVYAADLIGAFMGTFFFSILFIPFLGMKASLWALIFLVSFFALKRP